MNDLMTQTVILLYKAVMIVKLPKSAKEIKIPPVK